MNTEQNKALVQNFLVELDRGIDAVDRFFSFDCVAHLPGMASPTGRDGLKAFISTLYAAFPDLRHTVIDQIAEQEKVVTLVNASGVHKGSFQGIEPTEKPVVITDILITRIMNEKVEEIWAQFDALGLLQQLGACNKTA